jgi:hypothetical protein
MAVAPYIEEPPVWAQQKRALLLMDVFSDYHGLYLSHRAKEVYGAATVIVFSDYMKGYFQKEQSDGLDQRMTMCMPTINEKEGWCQQLEGCKLVAISCESDSGLADAEQLAVLLDLLHHNGVNEARRNKYLMLEAVGTAGLSVVKQQLWQNYGRGLSVCERPTWEAKNPLFTHLGLKSNACIGICSPMFHPPG